MTPDQIVAFVAALTMAGPDPAAFQAIRNGGADARYAVTVAACPRPLAPFEIEGRTVICGRVSVPQNHARPTEGRRIDLSFMVFRSHSLVPAPDAVVHLHGGPGSGIVERVSLTSTFFDNLRRRRDIVAFDQRGVDTSGGATRCIDTVADNVEAMAGALGGQNRAPHLQEDLTRACLAEIAAGGIDIANINTEQNARDVQAVMRALGYPVFNVYGISYGTKLGLEVMRSAPEGVRAVVLDSVAPPHIPTYDTLMLPHAEAFQAIFDLCAASAPCNAAYPNLRTRFWALMERLATTPIPSSEGPVTDEVLFTLIDERNAHQTGIRGLTAYVPLLVSELERGETRTIVAISRHRLPPARTAETVAAGLGRLSPNAQALARIALSLSRQAAEADVALRQALQALEADRAGAVAGLAVAATFEAALTEAVRALPDRQARVAFARDYLHLRARSPAAEPLLTLIAAHVPPAARPRLDALVQAMSPGDLAEVFRRMGTDNRSLSNLLLQTFQLNMFACQEDMDINSLDGARRLNATLGWPASITRMFEGALAGLYQACTVFPPRPRPGFHSPVTSPIPALVFSGLLDTQTAASWGPETARHLPNGRSIVFPETGHGALAFSPCAQDLGVAFIENPAAPLDTACVAALRPRFVLPDGTRAP